VRDLLLGLAVGGHLSPKERVRAALVLGELGDPRFTNFKFGRETRYIEPQLSHVIQPKTVLMKGIGRITQEAPYQIGLYPVTNAEYACFCEARGYERDEFWPAEGVGERNRRGWSQPAFWEDAVLGCPNFPVVGVSWYEAIAFCNWLSHVTGDCYRLPTEAEWQLAVQGIKSDLLYAWGEESPTDQCNWNRIVGSTSAVGIFPLDKGESGIFDVAGNVNEWTCDLYSKGGTMPAIRGGSWLDEEEKWLQCAYRDEYFPSGNFDHIGFRYVRILEGKEHRTAK
jgi:formylglycine-generating enzyme required for sulfatase activity